MLPTLELGDADAGALPPDLESCTRPFHDWDGRSGEYRGEANNVWRRLIAGEDAHVERLQRNLRAFGFKPHGPLDGIFGYRTQSAVRLFQEYVRTVDGDASIGLADGVVGPKTWAAIETWSARGAKADWTPPDDRQSEIFAGLQGLRAHFESAPPDPAIRALEAHPDPASTRRVAEWRFDPSEIHLIGIRRDDTRIVARNGRFTRRNDDIFVLLVNGIRTVFRGSTDPSPNMAQRQDAAFLIRGQHAYRFGWHKLSTVGRNVVKVYRAFKPKDPRGVLIARAEQGHLTDRSYENGAERNATINIHWSGAGTTNWSAGCQVVAGRKYKNFRGEVIDLSASAAVSYSGLGAGTRGAYNVLIDLVTVFAPDIRCANGDTLHYTLLYERDLAEVPGSVGIDFPQLVADLS